MFKMTNTLKKALALTLAVVMLATVVSCRKNDATETKEAVKYYPLTEECNYNNLGKLISRTEYEYSPEGYLLSERTSEYYYVRDFAGGENYSPEYNSSYLFGETDVSTYRYDKAGRLVEEYNGFHFDDGTKGLHYIKRTATYTYDDKGRRISTKEITKNYTVIDPLKGFNDDNMTQDSEDTERSECVITDDSETGGWKSLETFTYTGEWEAYTGRTVEMEYDAQGRLLSRTKTEPETSYKLVYTAHYEYDDKDRPVSAHIQTLFDGKEDAHSLIAVEYDEHSHIVSKSFEGTSDLIENPYIFEIQCEFDEQGRLTRRQRVFGSETEADLTETVIYSDDGTAVKDFVWKDKDFQNENEETVYSDLDENGNYHTLLKYILEGQDRELYQKVTRQYGEAIPSGLKYGTAGIRAEEEKVSSLQHNFDLGMWNEYLYYNFEESDEFYYVY